MSHVVALLPGDGVGPEVTAAARRVLDAAVPAITWEVHDVGSAAVARCGDPLPEEALTSVLRNGVALKGPLGSVPGGSPHGPLNVALRHRLGLFAQLRPVRSWPGLAGPPADVVVARELTEDFSAGIEIRPGARGADAARALIASASGAPREPEGALALRSVSEPATRRFFELLFDWAEHNGRKRVTVAHKATVMPATDGLFLAVAREVAASHPGIELDDRLVDALCAELVRDPGRLDVVAAPFFYGDILSDVAAAVTGGLGLAPGVNYGHGVAVFEAAHGTVPRHAGKDRVDPLASVLSGAMLLGHLGEEDAAERVRAAVAAVLAGGPGLTYDLVGARPTTVIGTAELAQRVIDHLERASARPRRTAPEPAPVRGPSRRPRPVTATLVSLGRRGGAGLALGVRLERLRARGTAGLLRGGRRLADDRDPSLAARQALAYRAIWAQAAGVLGAELEEFSPGFFRLRRGDAETLVLRDQVMLDTPASTGLAADKAVLHRLLADAGLPVPAFAEAPAGDPGPLVSFLERTAGPVVVKPARGTGGGQGVTCGVRDADQLLGAWLLAAPWASGVLVEEQSEGDEYRLLLLDGELLGTLRRRRPRVLGDGRRPIWALLAALNAERLAAGPEEVARLIHVDLDCRLALRAQGLGPRSTPKPGVEVVVKGSASENGRLDNETVAPPHPAVVSVARRAAETARLRLAGIDLLTTDPGRPLEETGGRVLEVNGTPGLRHHYQVANRPEPVAVAILERLLRAPG